MNKIYKVVWSRAKQCYVVVSELAKNTTKGAKSKKLLAAVMASGTMSAGIGGIIIAGDAAAAPATVENINIKDEGDVYGIKADGSDVTENVANGITVESTGTDKSHVAEGILADNSGTTNVKTKTISATVANGDALGVDAENGGKNDVTFTGSGAIDVKGEYAYGICADSNANNIIRETENNSGLNSITASGTEETYGVIAWDGSKNDVTFTGSGAMSVNGINACGIYANINANNIIRETENDSGLNSITASGTETIMGVSAWDGSQNDVTFTGNGTIDVNGKYAYGIYADSNANNIINKADDNSGLNSITTSGTEQAFGVSAWVGGTNTVNMVDVKDAKGNSKATSITAEGKEKASAVTAYGTDSITGKASSNIITGVEKIISKADEGTAYGVYAKNIGTEGNTVNTVTGATTGMYVDVVGKTAATGIDAEDGGNNIVTAAGNESKLSVKSTEGTATGVSALTENTDDIATNTVSGFSGISVTGNKAFGVQADQGINKVNQSGDTTALTIDVTSTGDGNSAHGIIAQNAGQNSVSNLADADSAKAIQVQANGNAFGISSYKGSQNNVTVHVTSEEGVETTEYAPATIDVTSNSDADNNGYYAYGVYASKLEENSANGINTVNGINSINVNAAGSYADANGISANYGKNTVSGINSIDVKADGANSYATGISAYAEETGTDNGNEVIATGNDAKLNVAATGEGSQAWGIYAGTATNTVENLKDISVSADQYAFGIHAYNGNNTVTAAEEPATLSVKSTADNGANNYAAGVQAIAGNEQSSTNSLTDFNAINATAASGITYGVLAEGTGARNTVKMAGIDAVIEAEGTDVITVVAYNGGVNEINNSTTGNKIAITAMSTADGGKAGGIYADGASASNTVSDVASISATAKKEADGIIAFAGGTNTIKGDNIEISATASDASGNAFGLSAVAGTINITGNNLNVTAKKSIYEANGGVVNLGKAKTETEDANTPAVTVTGDIVLNDSESTLYDYGSLTQTGDVYNAGTITVDGDASITGNIDNYNGSITLNGATNKVDGDVTNTGTINLNGATSNEITGTLANDGTVYTNNSATIGTVTGVGTTQVNDGTTTVTGDYTQGITIVGDTIGERSSAKLSLQGNDASAGVVTVYNDGMLQTKKDTAFDASSISNAGIVVLLGDNNIDGGVTNAETGYVGILGGNNTVAGDVSNDGTLRTHGNTTLQSDVSGTGETKVYHGTTTVKGDFAQSNAFVGSEGNLDLQGDVNSISDELVVNNANAIAKLGSQTTLNTASGAGTVEIANDGTTTATNMGTSDALLGTVQLDNNSTLHITDTANIDTVNGTNAAASKLVLNTDNYLKGQMNIGQNGGITGTGVSFADTSTSPLDKAKDHDAIYASLVNKDGSMNENATLKGLQDSVVKINEGLVAGEMDINYDANGGISSVAEKTNQHNQSLVDALSVSNRFSRLEMNDIRKRLGDVRLVGAESGIWTRFENGKLSGQGTDTKFNKYQIGYDRSVSDKWRLGGAVSYTKGTTDFNYGSNDLSTTSGALYGVYTGNNGLFGDVILRYGQEKTDVSFNNGVSGSISTPSYAVSGEIGKTYQLPNNTFIEPQAEIAYTHSNGDSFNDYSAYYDLQDVKSMTARLGVAYGYKAPDNKGLFYTKLSGVHEFLGESELNVHSDLVGSRTITNNAGGTWLEWSLGGQLFTSKSTYLYANVEKTFGADINEDYRFNFGMRYNF